MLKFITHINKNKLLRLGIICQLVALCFCIFLPTQICAMDGPEARRLMAGLELFPSFLAADQKIKTKKDVGGTLQLVILYQNDKRTAEKMAARLNQIGKIKSLPIHITISQTHSFHPTKIKPAGIFISQNNIGNLNAIVQYGKEHSIITFSPFTTDLKKGVTGSISITARIRPQVNMETLKSSHLAIKPFFLRISKQYTP